MMYSLEFQSDFFSKAEGGVAEGIRSVENCKDELG